MALSPTAKAAMFSQETEQVIIALLTITHPGTGEVFRISSDPTTRLSDDPLLYATWSRGHSFLFIPFDLVLPESSDEGSGNARLVISNVERELVPLLRHFLAPASVLIELILASLVTPGTLSTASQITCSKPTVYIAGSGGAVTLTSTPSIAAGTSNGQRCLLVGSHATNTVTLNNGNTIRLPGNTGTLTIGLNLGSPEFVWTGAEWVLASLPLQMVKQTGPMQTIAACGTATNPFYDGGSGNTLELCLTGTQVTLKIQCGGANCPSTDVQNLMLLADGAKPPCAVGHRFKLWPTASGAGVEDILEVCRKLTNDTYAWSVIDLP